jgi:hypothetical protein
VIVVGERIVFAEADQGFFVRNRITVEVGERPDNAGPHRLRDGRRDDGELLVNQGLGYGRCRHECASVRSE